MKFEYCAIEPSASTTNLLRTLEDGQVGQEAFSRLSDADVAAGGCAWTSDLSGLFQKHGAPRPGRPPRAARIPASAAIYGMTLCA